MDQEVAKTLGELELKLQELERELTSIGHRDTRAASNDRSSQAADRREEPANVPGKLVDEAVELVAGFAGHESNTHSQQGDTLDGDEARVEETAVDNAFGGPGVWGGEEVPAQAGTTVERDWTVEVRETAYGEIPTPPSPPEASNPPQPHAPSWPSPPEASNPPQPHIPSWPSPPEPPLPPPLPQPHHPYASTPPEREEIDVADLVRFKEKMQRTMDELIDEYSRLLSLRPPS
ncbi:MAG: hypothetical protein WBQ21_05805 [Solirubrobacteraceae bacterium]